MSHDQPNVPHVINTTKPINPEMKKQKKLKACEVRHVPVVAGETRPFSDVSAPGGGDVCGSVF